MNPFFDLSDANPLVCHVMCLPNAPSSPYFSLSHFAQKIRNLCWMLKSTGNKVTYYGYESCDVECDEKVIVASEDVLMDAYPRCESEFGHVDVNDTPDNPVGIEYLEKRWSLETGYELKKRYKPGDYFFWMLPMCGQRHLYHEIKDFPVQHVEPGIGYIGGFLPYKIFPSSYIRDFHYGSYHSNNLWYNILGEESKKERPHGSHYQHTYIDWEQNPSMADAVIPNSSDLSLFDFRIKKKDYLLYLGRVLKGKGVGEAVKIAEGLGMKLIVAGPGSFELAVGKKPGKNVEVVGPVGVDDRRDLLSHARAVLSLSHVHETFGLTAIEGMLSGTPPIVANTGGFLDTVRSGWNGYRVDYRDIKGGMRAIESLDKIDPYTLRKAGLSFSMEQCALRHNAYIQNIEKGLRHRDAEFVSQLDCDYYSQDINYPAEWITPIDKNLEIEENA